mmetsp:Transcript_24319/g.57971  ORF Transcript_24319/g.57971 Transcript_24319/m.57971 type:complete len:170 (-) Transcript_24319:833-1342(-)
MHDSPLESDSKFRKEHFTRSKTVLGYKAAGVLPYANIEGVPHALLGAERKRTGPNGAFTRTMWGDFGGHREASDDGDSVYTASREFSEETLGMFSSALVDPSSVADSTREMSLILRSRDAMQVRHKLKKVSPWVRSLGKKQAPLMRVGSCHHELGMQLIFRTGNLAGRV